MQQICLITTGLVADDLNGTVLLQDDKDNTTCMELWSSLMDKTAGQAVPGLQAAVCYVSIPIGLCNGASRACILKHVWDVKGPLPMIAQALSLDTRRAAGTQDITSLELETHLWCSYDCSGA